MLVYGDPQFPGSLSSVKRRLREARAPGSASLDDLRRILIQCGQLEQALADGGESQSIPGLVECAQRLTDAAAQDFCAAWRNQGVSVRPARAQDTFEGAWDRLFEVASPDLELTIKVPEGFAFYGLFPEQHCAAATEWLRHFGALSQRRVLVVGIRSIGTTLSAVVATTLRDAGCEAIRLTVRPTGAPFGRVVKLGAPLPAAEQAIVVDEGPGLSGSSTSAVADALMEAGFPRNQISFFPGHDRGPGPAAGEGVLANWRMVRQIFVPLEHLRWGGRTLEEDLAAKASEFMGDTCHRIVNISQGWWRPEGQESCWPAALGAFEKMKWRCDFASGGSVLWKFVGLGAFVSDTADSMDNAWTQLIRRANLGWSPTPLGPYRGFIAMPWVEGRPLTRRDFADSALLRKCGDYLAQTAGPRLSLRDQTEAHQRLFDMLRCNTEKALGPLFARVVTDVFDEPVVEDDVPSFTDGDPAAHNWIRTEAGALFKFGGLGHDLDHTLIGKQPLHWSVAGMVIDNRLSQGETACLISAMVQTPWRLSMAVLNFHCAAYAAFRLGQASISAEWEPAGSAEWRRLRRAIRYYRTQLKRVLNAVYAKDARPVVVQTQDAP